MPVDDTLQEALLEIYEEWPELQHAHDDERDRRTKFLYGRPRRSAA